MDYTSTYVPMYSVGTELPRLVLPTSDKYTSPPLSFAPLVLQVRCRSGMHSYVRIMYAPVL